MEKLMKVQVVAYSGKGAGSGIIKRMTRGRFSHVSLRFSGISKEVRDLVRDRYGVCLTVVHEIESIQFKGVIHHTFELQDNQTVFSFKHDQEQAFIILKTAIGLLGKKYDWRGIGAFATRRNKHHPDKFFCSELVAYCLLKAGIILLRWPPFKISPNFLTASPLLTEE